MSLLIRHLKGLCSLGSHQSGEEGSPSVAAVFQYIFSSTEWLSCSSLLFFFPLGFLCLSMLAFFSFWILELLMILFSTSLALQFHLYYFVWLYPTDFVPAASHSLAVSSEVWAKVTQLGCIRAKPWILRTQTAELLEGGGKRLRSGWVT